MFLFLWFIYLTKHAPSSAHTVTSGLSLFAPSTLLLKHLTIPASKRYQKTSTIVGCRAFFKRQWILVRLAWGKWITCSVIFKGRKVEAGTSSVKWQSIGKMYGWHKQTSTEEKTGIFTIRKLFAIRKLTWWRPIYTHTINTHFLLPAKHINM